MTAAGFSCVSAFPANDEPGRMPAGSTLAGRVAASRFAAGRFAAGRVAAGRVVANLYFGFNTGLAAGLTVRFALDDSALDDSRALDSDTLALDTEYLRLGFFVACVVSCDGDRAPGATTRIRCLADAG